MTYYASLADAKNAMNAGSASSTTDDAILLAMIGAVSTRVDLLMNPDAGAAYFAPCTEAREYEVRYDNVDSRRGVYILPSGETMLALTSVTLNGTPITATAYPSTRSPITMFRRANGLWYENNSGDPLTAIISGVWGYHRRYAQAWAAVDTLTAAIVSTTATTLTVADVDGVDEAGLTPRISAGNLLRIDDELVEVTETNTSANVITARRGVNGTTAATHLNAAAVSVFRPEETIRRTVARQAGMLYARRGAYEQQTITDVGVVTYPADLLSELRGVLQGFQYI